MLLLSATDLCKTHGLKIIFDHISLHIDSGDKIGLLGVNGLSAISPRTNS